MNVPGSNCKKRRLTLGKLFTSLRCCLFPGGSDGKASAYNAGDPGSIPGLGRSPGEGNGNPLQDSCLENSTDGGALQATIHGAAKSWPQLSNFTSLALLKILYLPFNFCLLNQQGR